MKIDNKTKFGFSLIELSIVIVVIGLLIIGITKGSRIIDASRIKAAQSLTKSSPAVSMEGLVFWFDAVDETAIGVGSVGSEIYGNPSDGDAVGEVKQSNPQATTRLTLSAVLDGDRPDYEEDGIGGLPSLDFTSSESDRLHTSTTPLSAGDDTYTLIAVWKAETIDTNWDFIISQGNETAADDIFAGICTTHSSGTDYATFCGRANSYVSSITLQPSVPYITIITVDNSLANNVSIYNNSNTATTGASGDPSSLDLDDNAFKIGAMASAYFFFDGLISEVIIFDRVLGNKEINDVNDYLSRKYNIQLN